MGQTQSKDELFHQQVNSGNIEGIKSLLSKGASLESIDKEGKTPLIVACMNLQLYNVAKTLIELGANVNAIRPGHHAGSPLHHAAKSGLEQTVKLLLSHGAKALAMNDDCQTPLDVARAKGYSNVVRAIEGHLCLFSGWLRELHGPGFLELLAPQLLSRKVWVAILPCGTRNPRKPFKLELAIYSGAQDAEPRTIVPLWKANLQEPNFNQPDPAAIIYGISRIPRRWRRRRVIKSSQEARRRIKLAPVNESEKQQLQRFCNACKGIPQVVHPFLPPYNQVPTAFGTARSTSGDEELGPASTSSANSSDDESYTSGASTSHAPNGSKCKAQVADPSGISAQYFQSHNTIPFIVQPTLENPSPVFIPSAPPAASDDGPVHYPSVCSSTLNLSSPIVSGISGSVHENTEESSTSTCTICLDAPVEGACVPCGHMAGCMSCLNEVKAKNWGCPVCRSMINQVIRIYAV